MSRLRLSFALLLVATVVATSLPVQAGDHAHTRQGFVLGAGLGGGSAQGRIDDDSNVAFKTDRVGGAAGDLRFGYAVSPNFVLALETAGWGRTDKERFFGNDVEIRTSLALVVFGVTWYPTAGGFYAKLGLGGGVVRQEYEFGDLTSELEENGGALLLAAGYEWRLSRIFALGAQLDLGVIGLGEVEVQDDAGDPVTSDVSFNFANFILAANWYFGS